MNGINDCPYDIKTYDFSFAFSSLEKRRKNAKERQAERLSDFISAETKELYDSKFSAIANEKIARRGISRARDYIIWRTFLV